MRNLFVGIKSSGSVRSQRRTEVHLSGVRDEGVVVDGASWLGTRAERFIIGFGRHCRESCFGQETVVCVRRDSTF